MFLLHSSNRRFVKLHTEISSLYYFAVLFLLECIQFAWREISNFVFVVRYSPQGEKRTSQFAVSLEQHLF